MSDMKESEEGSGFFRPSTRPNASQKDVGNNYQD